MNEKNIPLDPMGAKQSIMDYDEKVKIIIDKIIDEIGKFYDIIGTNWYSTRAVEFSTLLTSVMDDLCNKASIFIKNINEGACNSYNSTADKQKTLNIEVNNNVEFTFNKESMVPEGPDGRVGMNVVLIESALNDFTAKITELTNSFDALPSYILLYKEGMMRKYFFTKPESLKESVNETINNVINIITNHISQEVDTVNKASRIAIDELKQ